MAANESAAGPRPGRAETPPADHWQRWAAPLAAATPAEAVAAVLQAPALPVPGDGAGLAAPPPLPSTAALPEAGNSASPPVDADSPYRVLIVEDVITSGGQVIMSGDDLKNLGALTNHVVCVIDREQGGREKLREAGFELSALFTMTELKAGR